MGTPPPLQPLLPLSVPVHPPHRTGPSPMTGFSSFAGSLVPFGVSDAASTPTASIPVLQGRRRRANAVSVARPTFVQVREVVQEEREEEEEEVMRWTAEENVPTSPKERRKESIAGMEWEGVVSGMEGVGLEDGNEASVIPSMSALPLPSPLPPTSSLVSTTVPSSRPQTPPSTGRLLATISALSPMFSFATLPTPAVCPPRPLKRDRTRLEEDHIDGTTDRHAKRGRTSLAYFDLIPPPSSRSVAALGLPGVSLRPRPHRRPHVGRLAVSVM